MPGNGPEEAKPVFEGPRDGGEQRGDGHLFWTYTSRNGWRRVPWIEVSQWRGIDQGNRLLNCRDSIDVPFIAIGKAEQFKHFQRAVTENQKTKRVRWLR